MGVSSSLYASISGLNTMGNAMSVLGDNISNVNTIAFKSSRATFQDVLSQSIATAAGARQVGRGVTLSTVDGLFAQGSFESTSTATDLAIGGQGFFMLRAEESAAADMYSRAGEFRFDQEGNLVTPVGHFVQGWTIDSTTGEITGTIGDLNIGKSTPPVATTDIDVIVNVDSRKNNETTEVRLFDAWDGTNAAQANPTDPISSTNYEYTSAIKIYDSKGASHDISIYFDRTTEDNQWEYLIACDPAEDLRALTTAEQTIYAPSATYDYTVHKGAGALQYGIIDFSTQGDISRIYAYDIPPDGEVDPALNTNRIVLGNADNYYSFDSNFTGATTNQSINLNFGAKYSGTSTAQTQILVSNSGSFANLGQSNYITKETLWSSVYDSAGNQMEDGDRFTYTGYTNDGSAVSGTYTITGSNKIQDFLDQIGPDFSATATIDNFGRLKMTDNTGGDSGMYVTSFITSSANNADPFGGSLVTIAGSWGISSAATASGAAITTATQLDALDNSDTTDGIVTAGDVFRFSAASTDDAADGTAIAAPVDYTVVGGAGETVQTLLNVIEDLYDEGVIGGTTGTNVTASLDSSGRIRVYDESGNDLDITMTYIDNDVAGDGVNPFTGITMMDSYTGQVNITTSKEMALSNGRATTVGGTPIDATTAWNNVFEDGTVTTSQPALGTITFSGTTGGGAAAAVTSAVYTIGAVTDSVQDLLDFLETTFNAHASIDGAGRLVLRDYVADSSTYTSALSVTIDAYGAGAQPIFGTAGTVFANIDADDTEGEDFSRSGDTVSATFEPEALASTQYANSSTTIFQDQDGFAAGFLQSVSVDTDGIITGNFSNGQVLKKAQVALASFNNLAGLSKEGGNIFRETTDSGAPVTGAPGNSGLGSIAPNSLEQSNVDLGTEFVKLITTQRGFQANSKIITTTDEMLADLINIKR